MIRKVLASVIALLCAADSITTLAVIKDRIGYEANLAVARFVSFPEFHVVKFILTILILYAIHRMADKKLETVSYLTLSVFYSIVVINNLCVYVLRRSLTLNFPKLFVIFSLIFSIVYLSVHVTSTEQFR